MDFLRVCDFPTQQKYSTYVNFTVNNNIQVNIIVEKNVTFNFFESLVFRRTRV